MNVLRSRMAAVILGLATTTSVILPGQATEMAAAAPPAAHTASPQTPEAQAKATGKRVLIPSLTTTNSETYANPNGTRTLEESLVATRQRTATGWTPIKPPAPTAPALDAPPAGAGRLVLPGTSTPSVIRPNASTNPGMTGWAEAYANFPTIAYWGGDGTACPGTGSQPLCAKVGLAYDKSVLVRSFFQFDVSALAGKHIQNAQVNILEAYAPSCSATGIEVWETGPVGSGTTWNQQPSWNKYIETDSHAYGYTTCARNTIGWDATQAVIDGAGSSNVATFGLKGVGDETNNLSWRKFAVSPTPSLIVNYDSPPDVPGNLAEAVTSGGDPIPCQNHANAPYLPTGAPNLNATVTDADAGSLVAAHFQWYVAGNFNLVGETTTAYSGSGSPFSVPVSPAFQNGTDVAWRVQGINSVGTQGAWSQWCEFLVDSTTPTAPTVSSTAYPQAAPGSSTGTYYGGVGQAGAFVVTANGAPDVTGFDYCEAAAQCTPTSSNYVVANQLGGSATLNLSPVGYGPNDLYVASVNQGGITGTAYDYHFLVAHGAPAVGVWHMDEFGRITSVPDSSGNGHNGTTGTPANTYWPAGRIGESLHLTGSPAAVTTSGPVVHTNQSFSISAWVNLDNTNTGANTIVSQDGSQGSGFYLQYRMDSNKWVFMMLDTDTANPSADQAVASTPVQTGVWTHLVGEYDAGAGQLKIFVNGRLAGTAPHTNAWDAGGPFMIGRAKFNGTGTDYFHGAIDEVQAFQRVLPATAAPSDGEINIHDLATGSPVLQAFLPLNEGSGTVALDQSGYSDNGTLSGGATWTRGHANPLPNANAVHFDESTGQIVSPAPAVRTDNSFTVTAEVKLDSTDGNWQTLVSEDGQHASLFALQYCPNTGRWCFSVAPTDTQNPVWQTVFSNAVPQAGVWTQVTGVYDAAAQTVGIYVNGLSNNEGADNTQAVTSPPLGTTGNLVIGRGRQNDTNLAYLGGAIDDVHVYTGVATDQIKADYIAENQHNVQAPATPFPGALTSWFQADVGHDTTSGPVPQGYYAEGQFGLLAPADAPNTHLIFSCLYSGGQFVTTDPNCENNAQTSYRLLRTIGSVYTTPPAGIPNRPIYRCLLTTNGDHYLSTDPKCFNAANVTPEMLLGYVVAYANLSRFLKPDAPADHAMSTATLLAAPNATFMYAIGSDHAYEKTLGLLGEAGGDVPVYTCLNGGDEFLATSSTCGGGSAQSIAWIGNLWSTPPQATATAQLFDCQMADGSNERFDSTDSSCEGQTVVGPLGYLITQP